MSSSNNGHVSPAGRPLLPRLRTSSNSRLLLAYSIQKRHAGALRVKGKRAISRNKETNHEQGDSRGKTDISPSQPYVTLNHSNG
jgi:hypothetical protein